MALSAPSAKRVSTFEPPPLHPSRSPASLAKPSSLHQRPSTEFRTLQPIETLEPRETPESSASLEPSESCRPPDTLEQSDLDEEKSILAKQEDELSEEELRRLYDDEEIDRFLALFADYVSEVTMPGTPTMANGMAENKKSNIPPPSLFEEDILVEGSEDWVSIGDSVAQLPSEPTRQTRSLSEKIALIYLSPVLPPARPKPERFNLGRLRVTIQRLYLVMQPAYGPFLANLFALSTWKDWRQSAIYCSLFWIFWYKNLLMPALFGRILYSLLRRKIFPYPTITKLRERRQEVAEAEEFGLQVQTRLGVTSTSGMMEAWRLFRVFVKPKKNKIKHKKAKSKDKGRDTAAAVVGGESVDLTASATSLPQDDEVEVEATVLDDTHESQEENDIKRAILIALNEIVDLHERIKNIFLWRRPETSKLYTAVFAILLFVTYIIPAAYLMKIATFIVGVFYWHITPIIAALPPSERARLPPAFGDAPTDADHAMEMISQRIARGESIRPPPRKHKKPKKNGDARGMPTNLGEEEVETAAQNSTTIDRPGEVDWRKWGEKAATVKSWADHGKRLMRKDVPSTSTGQSSGLPGEEVVTCSFLAQHKASPGIIAITNTAIMFTPIHSSRAKIRIMLEDIRGVKKSAMRGLVVRWQSSADAGSQISEEQFMWVGGRDEVFAQLVGWGGRRWQKV